MQGIYNNIISISMSEVHDSFKSGKDRITFWNVFRNVILVHVNTPFVVREAHLTKAMESLACAKT